MVSISYQHILKNTVEMCKDAFGVNLVGVYLHGSLAMDCANQNSDIDLLIVIKKPDTASNYRKLIDFFMALKDVPKKGIEMSVVLKQFCTDFVYPTPFELHYGESHRTRYTADSSYLCQGEDEDLAAHFTMTKHRGVCLFGEPIDEVFADVPKVDYLASIFYDIADAKDDIAEDGIYHILNLCRTLAYVTEGKVMSKIEGGMWAMNHVDSRFISLVKRTAYAYDNGAELPEISSELMNDFVSYIYGKIGYTDK